MFTQMFEPTHLPIRLGLKNTPTAPLLRGKTPSANVPDMTLNNLIVGLQ